MRPHDWFLNSIRVMAASVERAFFVTVAAHSVNVYHTYGEKAGQEKSHAEWSAEVVQRADALLLAVRRA